MFTWAVLTLQGNCVKFTTRCNLPEIPATIRSCNKKHLDAESGCSSQHLQGFRPLSVDQELCLFISKFPLTAYISYFLTFNSAYAVNLGWQAQLSHPVTLPCCCKVQWQTIPTGTLKLSEAGVNQHLLRQNKAHATTRSPSIQTSPSFPQQQLGVKKITTVALAVPLAVHLLHSAPSHKQRERAVQSNPKQPAGPAGNSKCGKVERAQETWRHRPGALQSKLKACGAQPAWLASKHPAW